MARRCDWFLERCAEIIDEEKLVEFVGRVAAGKENDYKLSREGITKMPAGLTERLQAFKMLAEWGIGKPIQVVITNPNITPNDSVRSAQQIFDMIKKLEDDSKQLVPAGGGNGRH
jgi:hypothetical protein